MRRARAEPSHGSDTSDGLVPEEHERSAELIERLLGEPELRRRFRTDPAAVLIETGLPELAAGLGHGERALMTLEMRESRSSLAGVMVAAAAEAVDFAQLAEHAAPALAHDAGAAVGHLVDQPRHHPATPAVEPGKPGKPSSGAPAAVPPAAAQAPPSASGPATSGPGKGGNATGVTHPRASGGAAVESASPRHAHQPATEHAEPGPPAEAQDAGFVYPGDQASPPLLAAWMGAHARRAGLPPELPVMAALTESGLRNLTYGDRDSVGFFQMRLGIWNEGAYAGYSDRPDLQIQWFIDHALAVRNEDPAVARSPGTWGDWVADIEQPAAQYRYRYQLQLGTAQDLLRGASLAPTAPPASHIPVGQAALKVALRSVAAAGRDPGSSVSTGLDSAGLVQHAYAQQGIQMPRVAAEQFDVGMPVSRHELKPGDAVFFAERNGYIDRVGLYIGGGRFVSAADGGGGEKVSSLSDLPFPAEYAGARRYTAGALGDPSRYARPLPTVQS
jgi:NlpC/P60 family